MHRLIRAIAVVGAAGVVAAVAATADGAHSRRRIACGEVTPLRTLALRDRRRVNFRARRTTIAALAARRRPGRIVHGASAFERQTFEVVAQIVIARRTPNNVIQIVLYDDGAYMQAVLPPVQCLTGRTPGRALIAAARFRYGGSCGVPGTSWEDNGAVAYVSGVGFWGPRHGRGVAPNGAELAPVTGVRLIVGCGVR